MKFAHAYLSIVIAVMLIAPPFGHAHAGLENEGEVRASVFENRLSALHVPSYVWPCQAQNPAAIVVGLHGGCLHGRSFRGIASNLARRNFMFVSMDMRGYGRWHHERFGTSRDTTFDYDGSILDIRKVLSVVRQCYPSVPIYCLGESLGANLAMIIAAEMPELVDGVVAISLTTPSIFFSPRVAKDLLILAFHPARKVDIKPYLKQRLANRYCPIAEQLADPLGRNAQTVFELLKTIRVNRRGIVATKHIDDRLPLLFINGAQDKLSDNEKTFRHIHRRASSNQMLVVVPDSGHLMVESRSFNPAVLDLIVRWMQVQNSRLANLRPQPPLRASGTQLL